MFFRRFLIVKKKKKSQSYRLLRKLLIVVSISSKSVIKRRISYSYSVTDYTLSTEAHLLIEPYTKPIKLIFRLSNIDNI